VREGFRELTDVLGERVAEVELPEPFAHGHDWHALVMLADIARHYGPYRQRDPALLSERMRGMIEEGLEVTAVDYNRALDGIAALEAGLEKIFERFDAILTPAATGEAPLGLDSTGDPAFCTLWTACGVPAISLPLLTGSNGMPIGVQLVGRRFYDGRLLRSARWLRDTLSAEGQDVRSVMGNVA
jgi:Asp-tRNA(Asn)/Glu-tRNA(Gln) amidotransferase A subunit family amidase